MYTARTHTNTYTPSRADTVCELAVNWWERVHIAAPMVYTYTLTQRSIALTQQPLPTQNHLVLLLSTLVCYRHSLCSHGNIFRCALQKRFYFDRCQIFRPTTEKSVRVCCYWNDFSFRCAIHVNVNFCSSIWYSNESWAISTEFRLFVFLNLSDTQYFSHRLSSHNHLSSGKENGSKIIKNSEMNEVNR